MIDFIRYTVDGKTYDLIDNGDGTWNRTLTAPDVAGNYSMSIEISENGIVSYIDGSDSRYSIFLEIIESAKRKIFLIKQLPDFLQDVIEYQIIFDIEDADFDQLYSDIEKTKNDMYIISSSNDGILRRENFLEIKGQGTLAQRKRYLISLRKKGKKLNEGKIKDIVKTITGSECITKFFGSDELPHPDPGYGLLMVQVLSPYPNIDYRYDDIYRTLKPLVPGHIKLAVIKYFATWHDIVNNFADWESIKNMNDWTAVKNYIPPQ